MQKNPKGIEMVEREVSKRWDKMIDFGVSWVPRRLSTATKSKVQCLLKTCFILCGGFLLFLDCHKVMFTQGKVPPEFWTRVLQTIICVYTLNSTTSSIDRQIDRPVVPFNRSHKYDASACKNAYNAIAIHRVYKKSVVHHWGTLRYEKGQSITDKSCKVLSSC